jgi:hypothetical protein
MSDNANVFCLAGLPGCGKSTAAALIEKIVSSYHEPIVTSEVSDFVRTKFEAENDGGVDLSPESGDSGENSTDESAESVTDNELGRWAADKKDEHGNGHFVRQMCDIWQQDEQHLVISGLRSPEEAAAARDVFGNDRVAVIGLWTLPDLRFERKYGGTPTSDHPEWDTFQERNERETHEWGCVEFFTSDGVSDYVVPNNDRKRQLYKRLVTVVRYELLDAGVKPEHYPLPEGLDEQQVAQYL